MKCHTVFFLVCFCTVHHLSRELCWATVCRLTCLSHACLHHLEHRNKSHEWNARRPNADTRQPRKQMLLPSKELVVPCKLCAVSTEHIHHSEAKTGRGTDLNIILPQCSADALNTAKFPDYVLILTSSPLPAVCEYKLFFRSVHLCSMLLVLID